MITFGEITVASAANRRPADRDRVEQEFLEWRKHEMQRRLHRRHRSNRKKARKESGNGWIPAVTQVIAFAGGPGPENTLAAVKQSLNLDVRMLEFDVRLTSDRVAVLMHDADISRTTDATGNIADMTFAEVRKLDAGAKYVDPATGTRRFQGERVPSLADVLKVVIGKDITVLLDVKDSEAVLPVIEVVGQFQAFDRVVFRVEDDTEIQRLKKIERRVQCAPRVLLSRHETSRLLDRLNQPGVVACTPEPWQELTPTLISRFHRAGVAVWVTGADRPEDVHQMIDAGIDGLFTSSPAEVKRLICDTKLRTSG